nr:UBX domain-containing protein 4 [Anser cygnoides]
MTRGGGGEDEQSTEMAARWEDEKVTEAASDGFVAIKIDTKSEACLQFSQIYPVVCVPSSFFIGDNGIPLEVIAGSVSVEELVTRIHKVKQMHAEKGQPLENPSQPSAPPCSSSQSDGAPENVQSTAAGFCDSAESATSETIRPSAGNEDGANSGQASQEAAQSSDAQASGAQPANDLALKVERDRAERAARFAKSKEEAEAAKAAALQAKQAEIEARKEASQKERSLVARIQFRLPDGSSFTNQFPSEARLEEARQFAAQTVGNAYGNFSLATMFPRREFTKEDYGKKLLELELVPSASVVLLPVVYGKNEVFCLVFPKDRAERAARFAKSKEEAEAAKAAALQAKQAELEARKEASQKERSLVARIQFRLPDGSSFTNQFPSEARLEEARQFAAQTVGNAYGNFSLATMFPRREFTKEDYGKKLLELELVPSASVVLLPAGRPATSVVQASGGDLWKFLGTILYPLLAVWRFISNFLFTSPPPPQSAARTAHQQDHSNPSKPSNNEQSRQTVRKRVIEKRGEDFKKEGKIYRLRTQDDGEDENNTWNGNSTQQM